MHSSFVRWPLALPAAIAALLIPLAAPLAVRADTAADAGTGVARINLISGSAAVQRGDSAEPIGAVVNAPVLGADYVTTGPASRAEIQFDGASSVRLGENAQIRFAHLDAGNREVQLAQGTVELRLLRTIDGRTIFDTPSVSLRPLQAGAYRVSVDADGRTQLTVRSGRAAVMLPQGDRIVAAGSTLLAEGSADGPAIDVVAAAPPDAFDAFNGDRDRHEARALADLAYVGANVQGTDDLYAYGRWVDDGTYGRVWVPSAVAADWAPYRDGRWVWEDGFGWTWVGSEPWGWAPYHYGRWYHSPMYGWAWYPPRPAVVEVWRPALVAFIGFGGGASLGFGNIGWVPLAPFEPYHPWWGRGYGTTVVNNTYVTNVTTTNVNNVAITRVYHNAQYGGVTSVTQQRFLEGRFDQHVAVTPEQLRTAQVAHGALPIAPTHANLRFEDHPQAANPAVRPVLVQRTYAGHADVVTRTPFEAQRARVTSTTPGTPAPATMMTAPRAAVHAPSDAWSRFERPRGGPTLPPAHAVFERPRGGATPPPAHATFDRHATAGGGRALEGHATPFPAAVTPRPARTPRPMRTAHPKRKDG